MVRSVVAVRTLDRAVHQKVPLMGVVQAATPAPILLYDGVCGLCNRSVQFILRRDRKVIFCFASLQSPISQTILARHGANPTDLDTVYLAVNYSQPDEALLARSDAVADVLRRLGGVWSFFGAVLRLIPRPLRDWGYNLVARNRYRIFGHYDTCPVPTQETRSRFLDQQP
jgi:predicted DCC family thiol-disulfide oxidoreductase YuxK